MPAVIVPVSSKRIFIQIAVYWMIVLIVWQNGYCSIKSHETNVVKSVQKARLTLVNISSQYEIRKNSNSFSGYGVDPRTDNFFRNFFLSKMIGETVIALGNPFGFSNTVTADVVSSTGRSIKTAKRIVSDLIRFEEVVQAWIGLTIQP